MKPMRKYGRWKLILILAGLACPETWAAGQVRSVGDRAKVAHMNEKKKTGCVGRFLIDVPEQAVVRFSSQVIDGFKIDTIEEGDLAFSARVAARATDIQSRGSATDGTGGMVKVSDLHVDGMMGQIFVFGRNRGYLMSGDRRIDDEFVSVEAHGHTKNMSLILSMQIADEADAEHAQEVLARLRMRAEDEVPPVSGFCSWRAVFTEPLPRHTSEHIVMHIGLPSHPDLGVVFASSPGGRRNRGLLARSAATDAEAPPDELLRVTKLRAGERNINGMPGEEVLERVRELNFATTFGFMWETHGVHDDPLNPFISLELQAGANQASGGRPVGSSLHEDAVLALWDSISSSIRLRKTDFVHAPGESRGPGHNQPAFSRVNRGAETRVGIGELDRIKAGAAQPTYLRGSVAEPM
jgi:hypothetical protein